MSRLRTADFYYGCVLSMLFNNRDGGIVPILVKSSEERRVYNFSTDEGDVVLFIKYRSNCNKTKKQDYKSWAFTLTDDDVKKIKEYTNMENKALRLALVLGMANLHESELAILYPEEVDVLIESCKGHFTITRQKKERAFRIIMKGSRKNSLRIPTNRKLF